MGNLFFSSKLTQYDKKVVIVGASFAGLTVAEQLWDQFEVVIIDKQDFFEYTCTNVKQIVNDKNISDISLNYGQLIRTHAQKAQFIQASLINVNTDSTITIQRAYSNDQENMEFDYLVICTGSEYNEPFKDLDVSTLQERKSKVSFEQEAIKKAESILIVGSGPVGVEIASEIAHQYSVKNEKTGKIECIKKIGIVTKEATLLHKFNRRAQEAAIDFMQRYNVCLHLSNEYNDNFKNTYDYEYVIKCTGNKFQTDFMNQDFHTCLSQKGQIFVNDFLQVTNINPLNTKVLPNEKIIQETEILDQDQVLIEEINQIVHDNIFCLGDVCLTRLNEEKSIYPLKQCAKICANNIKLLTQHNFNLQRLPNQFNQFYNITLGPEEGIFIMNDYVKVGNFANRQKLRLQNANMGYYKGNTYSKRQLEQIVCEEKCLICLCNSPCCCCCPCALKQH